MPPEPARAPALRGLDRVRPAIVLRFRALCERVLDAHAVDDLACVQVLGEQGPAARLRGSAQDQRIPERKPVLACGLDLMVALQEAIDIAYDVVSDEGWGLPESHHAAFELLAARGVLGSELARQVAAAASLRNRIAHGYASVEHERIWRELPEGLTALDSFAAAIAAWLPAPGAP